MRTEAQILASRLNGAKSRGPVTPEGKRRSAANALRHGCRAGTPELVQTPCARTPEQEQLAAQRYDAILTRLRNHWKPTTPDLERLVEQLATICLRINRLDQCEEDILSFAGIGESGRRTGGLRTNEDLERAALTLRSLPSLMRHGAQLEHARATIEAQLRVARAAAAYASVTNARTSEPAREPGAHPVTVSASRTSEPAREPGAHPVTVSAARTSEPAREPGAHPVTVSAARTSEPAREPGARPVTASAARTSEPSRQPATTIKSNNITPASEPTPQPRRPTYGPDGRRIHYPVLAA